MTQHYHKQANGESAPGTADEPQVWRFGAAGSALDAAHTLARLGRLGLWDSVLVLSQSAGRGQLRRHWTSPPGNIYAALRVPTVPPFDTAAAAPAVGVLAAEALRASGLPVLLKWPNDLVLLDASGRAHKVGGILLEERANVLLAGIGINVRSSPSTSELREDAALVAGCLQTRPDYDDLTAEALWYRLVKHIHSSYNNGRPLSGSWRERAEALLLWRGRQVLVCEDGRTPLCGRLAGLGEAGGLRLATDGKYRELLSGSVRLSAS